MPARRKRKASPLSQAIRYFIAGAVSAVAAFLIPLDSLSCTNDGYGQVCIHYIYTYDGIDGHTFKFVLGAIALLCVAMGIFYITRHNKAQVKQKSGTAFPASQPVAPQQPGMYPPPQNNFPGNYSGNAQPLPPSNEVPYNPYR